MPFLLATLLTCPDADELISNMSTYKVSEQQRSELIQVVKDSAEKGCSWDAKAD